MVRYDKLDDLFDLDRTIAFIKREDTRFKAHDHVKIIDIQIIDDVLFVWIIHDDIHRF